MTSPEKNNLQQLKVILKLLAKHQASVLNDNSVVPTKSDYSIYKIANLNTPTIDLLQKELSSNNQLLLQSIWTSNSVQIINNDIFLNNKNATTKVLPPAFDALMFIFSLSDNKFRQKYFEDLTQYYFDCLKELLHNDIVSKIYCQKQVRILLPIVKFELLNNNKELSSNIDYYLKYPLINQEDIYEVIKMYLNTTDYDLLDYQLIPLKETNGHLGQYYNLNIKIAQGTNKKEIKLFAKFLIPKTEMIRLMMESGVGMREDFFFNTFYQMCIENGLENILDFAPRCYLSRINWLIVLDDLTTLDFICFKPNVLLDYYGLSALVKKLAKLHATSLILEETLSKQAGKIVRIDDLYEEYFDKNLLTYETNPMKILYDNSLEVLHYIAEKFPEIISELNLSSKDLFNALKAIYMNLFCQYKNDTKSKLRSVVNHGDTYVSNALFKYNNDKKHINEAILIDFQLIRYMPPGFELLFALISSSSKETRDKYLQKLIYEYYENVCKYLREFDINSEEVFPKKLFMENIQIAYPASLSQAFIYGHVIHIDPDFRENLIQDEEKTKYYFEEGKKELVNMFWKDEHYRGVLKGFIEDFAALIKKEFACDF